MTDSEEPEMEPAELGIDDGTLTGLDRLVPTEAGFEKWEWIFHSGLEDFYPYKPSYVTMFTDGDITEFEYWLSDNEEEPDRQWPELREEYDAQGRPIHSVTYGRELGFEYRRWSYDERDRLVRTEHRVSPTDVGWEAAEMRPSSSFSYEYYVPVTEDEPGDVYRVTRTFEGAPIRLEWERKTDSGWEYVYDMSHQGPISIGIDDSSGHVATVTVRYPASRLNTKRLEMDYGDNDHAIESIETKLDGESPLFTTEYAYDEEGRMVSASIWDHRTEEQGQVYTFSDHDERGNWRRSVVEEDGEVLWTVVRRFVYR